MTAIHPLLDLVDVRIRNMNHFELGHFVVNLADSFAAHGGYKHDGAIPPPLLKPDKLKEIGLAHLAIAKAAESGDRFKKAERDAARPMTELHPIMLINWAAYRAVAENNPSLIADLGLPPKSKTTTRNTHPDLSPPQNPQAKHGKATIAMVSVNRVIGAVAYYVGICKGDPSQEECWSTLGPFHKSQNMEIKGLEPGQLYYFRVCCADSNGQSDWSPIVSLRIL